MSQWFRVECGLHDHPKVRRLARALGQRDTVRVVGGLVLFWDAVRRYCPDGDLSGFDRDEVAGLAHGLSEDGPKAVDALEECGFLDQNGQGLLVHDWMSLNGHHIRDARRKADDRASRIVHGQSTDSPRLARAQTERTERTDKLPMPDAAAPGVLELSPPAGNGKPADNQKAEWLEAFEQDFYPAYPRKVKPDDARKAWLAMKPWSQENCDAIISGLARWNLYWLDSGTPRDKIPYPGTFLRGGDWRGEAG